MCLLNDDNSACYYNFSTVPCVQSKFIGFVDVSMWLILILSGVTGRSVSWLSRAIIPSTLPDTAVTLSWLSTLSLLSPTIDDNHQTLFVTFLAQCFASPVDIWYRSNPLPPPDQSDMDTSREKTSLILQLNIPALLLLWNLHLKAFGYLSIHIHPFWARLHMNINDFTRSKTVVCPIFWRHVPAGLHPSHILEYQWVSFFLLMRHWLQFLPAWTLSCSLRLWPREI